MSKRHLSPYFKLVVIIVISGFIGGVLGFATSYFNLSIASIVNSLISLIQYNAHIIMWFFVVSSFIFCILCYRKSDQLLHQFLAAEDDDEQDILEQKFDFWGTCGISVTNIILSLSIVLFAFPFTVIFDMPLSFFIQTVVSFLICLIICSVYQIAIVKQIKKKDPAKYDDAMSLNFQKKYLETCDEGERQLIYLSSYKTFQLSSRLLLFALVIALLAHFHYGNGLLAIVLLGSIYIIMMTAYSIYSIKLQKTNSVN